MNFDVRLLKKRRNARFKLANLTLPERQAGETLLQVHPYVNIKGQHAQVTRSNKDANPGTLRRILSTEWQDPEILRREQERLEANSRPIPLDSFAFGRLCDGYVFSPEATFTGTCAVVLDMANRRMTLTYKPTPAPARPADDAASSRMDIMGVSSIDLSSIFQDLMVGDTEGSAFFPASKIGALAYAGPLGVVVESEVRPTTQVLKMGVMSSILDRDPIPERVANIDGNAAFQYVGRQFLLRFKTAEAVDIFWQRCVELRLRHPSPSPQRVTVRDLDIYSPERMNELRIVLRSLDFSVAFEATKAVYGGILEPAEVVKLQPAIARLSLSYGLEFPDIFRVFVANLETCHLTPGGRRGRRARRPYREHQDALSHQPRVLVPQLEDAAQVYVTQLQRPRHRLRTLSSPTVLRSFFLVVTPSTFVLEGPLPDQGNSVLRRFGHHDSFLRVSFEDEDLSKMRAGPGSDISALLKQRFRPLLVDGFQLAGRNYEFLGYSMSGLRQHSVWFVSPYRDEAGVLMNAESIRTRLGDFSRIAYKPARLAARWAQAFSTSDPSVTLDDSQIRQIDDKIAQDGTCFTDGCGTISTESLREVWTHMRRSQGKLSGLPKPPPSCLQFRHGGYKGVLVEDNRLEGKVVCFRPSQRKFNAPAGGTLDITATSTRPIPMFLNRPMIVLMEYHGVDEGYIFRLQERAIADVHSIFASFERASYLFQSHGLGASFGLPSLFKHLDAQLDIVPYSLSTLHGLKHQLLDICLCYGATHVLREIKHRARIPVPGSVTLIGVSDEWDCLAENEIFATVYDPRTGDIRPIEGDVLITRSPQIHPGDLQVVRAVRRPQLQHLRNAVVFPCRGRRSLPSCLAGGDLDGDIFNLILDPNLMPRRVSEPGSYKALEDRTLNRPCTIGDIADFIIDYIKSDLVGTIAIHHLILADLTDPGQPDCIKLAEYASHAVDFPKTGTAVQIGDLPRVPSERPDFLAHEGTDPSTSRRFYPSKKTLGKLFRNVPMDIRPPDEDYAEPTHGSMIRAALPAITSPPAELRREMQDLMEAYIDQLFTIANSSSLSPRNGLSEGELVSGTIQATWNDHQKRRDAVAVMNFQTHELVKVIRRELRGDLDRQAARENDADEGDFYDDSDDDEDEEFERREETLRRAYAAWIIAEEAVRRDPDGFGAQSFGLIALGMILHTLHEESRAYA
ncbi:RdRP-domain-containing protein [Gloeophyllum trabeum ATCC 11539]|uniref:RNA-dependent RNA polymerase n=1 Tax=Gloeophyllum trabeum (strain ATCC 11539 / FP-39264 / Madison 617) TaxID=670483 RepID=S7S580_GLOTA|nr:RdRP-domain-containing protein [Gloeophyllum trabeum ATCC 11539]EPQ61109.1 RdRP-domain-containing protein [Gloeophyllum trabeum ATCC 11539]